MTDSPPSSKVYYRPIEAAIRWAGLLKFKKEILSLIPTPMNLPPRIDCCPRWSELRLHGTSAKRPRLGTMRSLRADGETPVSRLLLPSCPSPQACMCSLGNCICNVFPPSDLFNQGHANERH